MRTLAVAALTTAALLVTVAPAAAQIVNLQPLLRSADEDGVIGELTLSVDWKTGNTDLFIGKAGLLLRYRDGAHRLISTSSGELGIKAGEDILQKVFTHLRWQWELTDLLTWETFTQVSHDAFTRLTLRALVGTGARLDFVRGPAVGFSWGLAYMFEHEELATGAFADSGRVDNNHRLTTYLTGHFIVEPLITLHGTVYYQPRFDAFVDDFRVSGNVGLAIKVAEHLAINIGFGLSYDHEPPADVKSLDTGMEVALTVGF